MRFQENQGGGCLESEGAAEKWVMGGMKSVYTGESDHGGDGPSTPTGDESRIQTLLTCPPAPRKKRKKLKHCKLHKIDQENNRDFFRPIDLQTVFMCHIVQTAAE